MVKKWETKEWWEKRPWPKDEVEAMEKEELERLSKQPWFESGKPCKTDIFAQRDWQEEFELIWGKWGCHGIGKLKKAALSMPHEYELNPLFAKEPAYYRLYQNRLPDLDKWRKTFEDYAKALEGEGIEVFWLEPPESPLGPYGLMRAFCTMGGFQATKAGLILPRMGRFGVCGDMYSKHFTEQAARIVCPIYHMMLNVSEITALYLAEHSALIAEGYPTPREGAEEYKTLLEALGDEVWVANTSGPLDRWGFPAGTSHLDMVLGVVDLGLAICFPSFLDYRTIRYLKSKKVRLIEVPSEEFLEYGCNILVLDAGKIVIPAAAKETIKALRKEGVECLDFDFSESAASGLGGPFCITGKLYREPGPTLDDLAHL